MPDDPNQDAHSKGTLVYRFFGHIRGRIFRQWAAERSTQTSNDDEYSPNDNCRSQIQNFHHDELELDLVPNLHQPSQTLDSTEKEIDTLNTLQDFDEIDRDSNHDEFDLLISSSIENTEFNDFDRFTDGAEIFDELEVPDYDPNAQQSVEEISSESFSTQELRARQRAADIVSRISFTSEYEQDITLNRLIDLFVRLHHHSTYRAIIAASERGLNGETLNNMIELREIWAQRSEWWVQRRGSEVRTLTNGEAALTWKLAQQICEVRWNFPPEYMIDYEWLGQWQHLDLWENGYWSFPDFIKTKILIISEISKYEPYFDDTWRYDSDEFQNSRD